MSLNQLLTIFVRNISRTQLGDECDEQPLAMWPHFPKYPGTGLPIELNTHNTTDVSSYRYFLIRLYLGPCVLQGIMLAPKPFKCELTSRNEAQPTFSCFI